MNQQTEEPFWPYVLAFTIAVLAGFLVVTLVQAGPVPDRTEARPPNGTRGQPELRDPSLAAPSLARLLRSCHRCHGEAGPNKRLFSADGRPLWQVPAERFRWGAGVVIRSQPGDTWYPTDTERDDLKAALAWLSR